MSELKKCPMPGCSGEGVPRTDENGVDLVECSNDGGDGDPCELWYATAALFEEVWQALPRQSDAVAVTEPEVWMPYGVERAFASEAVYKIWAAAKGFEVLGGRMVYVHGAPTQPATRCERCDGLTKRIADLLERAANIAGQAVAQPVTAQDGALLVRMSCPDCGTALVPREDAFACPKCDTYCGGPDGKAPRVSPVYGAQTQPSTEVVLCEPDECAWVGAIDAIAEALGIKDYAFATEVMEAVRSVVQARDGWKRAEHEARHGIADCLSCTHLGHGDPLVDPVAKERDLLRAVRNSICPDCNTEGWTKHEDGKVSSCITCHGVGYGRTRMRTTLDALQAWDDGKKKKKEGL